MNEGQFFHGLLAGGDSIPPLAGLLNKTNGLVCSAIGPGFAELKINKKNCQSGLSLLPNSFKSMEHFCYCYNRASDQNKKCLTDGALSGYFQLTGIVRFDGLIGQCCAPYGDAASNLGIRITNR